jgi:hypothetical protein
MLWGGDGYVAVPARTVDRTEPVGVQEPLLGYLRCLAVVAQRAGSLGKRGVCVIGRIHTLSLRVPA